MGGRIPLIVAAPSEIWVEQASRQQSGGVLFDALVAVSLSFQRRR